MAEHRVYTYAFKDIYVLYVKKIERKGRDVADLDEIIMWLTGYSRAQLNALIADGSTVTLKEFFRDAPQLNTNRSLITGVICGVRIEEIEDPLMREIRYLDKVVDELARGRAMQKIMRAPAAV